MKTIFAILLIFAGVSAQADLISVGLTETVTSGTCAVTETREYDFSNRVLVGRTAVYEISWTSDSSGNVVATFPLSGVVRRVVTNPGAAAPTANYDITIDDVDGIDTMQGYLANRHTSNSEQVVPLIHDGSTTTSFSRVGISGTVTLEVANAGSAKTGVIRIYMDK